MRIELLASVEHDLLDGFTFYERQKPGLGQYFLDTLFSDIDALQLYAGIHETVQGGYHRLLSRRFPYAVYYRLDDANTLVRIYAVLDCRQSPERTSYKLATRND